MHILEPASRLAGGFAPRLPGTEAVSLQSKPEDRRWQLAQRIAASGSLGRSRLLADFLLYIVDRHINDRADQITERHIGVLVFGRREDYDLSDDNIVRSYARNLRKRVDEYFATEGCGEDLLLEIPRGGYTPIFSARNSPGKITHVEFAFDPGRGEESTADSHQVESSEAKKGLDQGQTEQAPSYPIEHPQPAKATGLFAALNAGVGWHTAVFAICVGLALGILGTGLLPVKSLRRAGMSSAEAASAGLWAEIFSGDRDTFIVPSDDGLIIMQGLTVRPVPLSTYINGSYRTNVKTDTVPGAPEIMKLSGRRYTSVVDLDFVAHLAQLNEVVPGRMLIRYARDLRMDDLRAGNAVLIGSIEANPWIELFEPQLNFRFSINAGTGKPSGIINSHPRAGENAIYSTPGTDRTYGLIAYLPNLDATGHVLLVGGLNTAGTEAATKFLLNPSLMMQTLQRAKTAHGSLQSFELLIGAGNVASNASSPQMILERVGPSL